MVDQKLIGTVIRELRERVGETQPTFSKRLNVTVTTLCRYEAGTQKPKSPVVKKLAEIALIHRFPEAEVTFREALKDRALPYRRTPLETLIGTIHTIDAAIKCMAGDATATEEIDDLEKIAKLRLEMGKILTGMILREKSRLSKISAG